MPASYGPRNDFPTRSRRVVAAATGRGPGPGIGAVDVISAVTPELRGRQALLAEFGSAGVAFVAHARVLRRGRTARLPARLVRRANSCFQIEKLNGVSATIAPCWQRRYVLHDGASALPRAALGVLWVEGQLPRLELRRLAGRGRRTHVPAGPIAAA
jgi:hypothetical protein